MSTLANSDRDRGHVSQISLQPSGMQTRPGMSQVLQFRLVELTQLGSVRSKKKKSAGSLQHEQRAGDDSSHVAALCLLGLLERMEPWASMSSQGYTPAVLRRIKGVRSRNHVLSGAYPGCITKYQKKFAQVCPRLQVPLKVSLTVLSNDSNQEVYSRLLCIQPCLSCQ